MFGLLLVAGGAVYSSAQAVIALMRGSMPAAFAAGGLATFFLGIGATLAFTWFGSSTRFATSDNTGTTLRINPYIPWSYGSALVGAVIGSASYLTFLSRGSTEIPLAAPGRDAITRYLMIGLLILSLVGLVALLRRRGAAYLRLSPVGIESADIFRTRSARWGDILDITDQADNRSRNPIVFVLADAKLIVVPNADRYAPTFGTIYWMARHYWRHPADRTELTSEAALARFHSGKFTYE